MYDVYNMCIILNFGNWSWCGPPVIDYTQKQVPLDKKRIVENDDSNNDRRKLSLLGRRLGDM